MGLAFSTSASRLAAVALLLATWGCAGNVAPHRAGALTLPSPAPAGSTAAPARSTIQPAAPRRILRRDPAIVSGDEIRAVIFANGFYSKRWNETGHGIAHAYEVRALGGVLVVVDAATGLMWQKFGRPDRAADNSRQGADEYVAALNRSGFAGFHDWRLPTLEEALSLMTDDAHGQPMTILESGPTTEAYGELQRGEDRVVPAILHIDPVFDEGFSVLMWTADFHADPSAAGVEDRRVRAGWLVDFLEGSVTTRDLVYNGFVRALRSL